MRGSWKSRSAPVARPNKSPAIGCPPRWCGSHEPGLTPNLEQEPSSHGSLSQEPEHEPSSWFRIRFEPTTGRSLCRRLSIRRSWPLRYSSTDLPQDGLPQLRALKTIAGFLNAKRGYAADRCRQRWQSSWTGRQTVSRTRTISAYTSATNVAW